jgi:hypothetical protein
LLSVSFLHSWPGTSASRWTTLTSYKRILSRYQEGFLQADPVAFTEKGNILLGMTGSWFLLQLYFHTLLDIFVRIILLPFFLCSNWA